MNQPYTNPFTPIFGKVPAYMAGREQLAQEMQAAFRSEGNDPSLVSLFVGPRGTGKTAMLSMCADMAEADGWVAARVTATKGMLEEIIQRLNRSASHLLEKSNDRKISAVGIAPLGTVEWENLGGESLSWRSRMDAILDQLAETGTGLLVTVDEVDPDLDEMVTLVTAYQHFFDENRKVALLMAGLPYRLSSLLSGKSTSFLRRAARHSFGSVSDAEVDEALRLTMRQGGKSISGDALDAAIDAIEGFPYMLQLVGYRTWNMAKDKEKVEIEDVVAASEIAQRELDERVFESTLFDLTPADVAFLKAMLQDDGPTLQADMASRLKKKSGHVSKYKKRLLQQGVIEERTKGRLEFCLPGFREYLIRESI